MTYFTRLFSNMLILLCFLMTAQVSHALTAKDGDTQTVPQLSSDVTVQVLTYNKDDLINQGSGIVVSKGAVVTSAHLMDSSSRVVLRDAHGNTALAEVVTLDEDNDLVLLRFKADGALAVMAAKLSYDAVGSKDVVYTLGYWRATLEDKRSKGLFGPSRPSFKAAIQADPQQSSGMVDSVSDKVVGIFSTVGRGAYGAAVFNECGHVTAMVRLPEGVSKKQSWKRHLPKVPLTAVPVNSLKSLLLSQNIEILVSEKTCVNPIAAMKAEQDRLKKELDQAKKEQGVAEKKNQESHEKSERDSQASKEALEGMGQRLQDNESQLEEGENEREEILKYAAIGGGGLVLLILIIWGIKSSKVKKVSEELEQAVKTYHDCLLKGKDSNGNPVALRLSGRDLIKSEEGVIIGRNPENTGLVLSDETVSRNHARIFVRDDDLFIEDMNSTGGTQVSGVALQAGQPRVISNGDVIAFAHVHLELQVLS